MKKRKSTKHLYVVELVRPPGMTDTEMCYFVRDAIQAEPGHHRPEDPRSQLDRRTVQVKSHSRVLTALQNQLKTKR